MSSNESRNIEQLLTAARAQLESADRVTNADRRFGLALIAIGALVTAVELQQRRIEALEPKRKETT